MSSLSQASRLEFLPSSHDAFQGHAIHKIEWSICLGPRTQRVPVYPQVLPHSSRLLHGAPRPLTTTPHPPPSRDLGMSSGVSPFLLSTSLRILRGASHVHSSGLLRRPVGGGLPTIPSALCGSPTRPRVAQGPLRLPFPSPCNSEGTASSGHSDLRMRWLSSEGREDRGQVPRRMNPASGTFTMGRLRQAPRLAGLPPAHGAFQGHAAHLAEWPATLSPNDAWGACTPTWDYRVS